MGFFNEMYLDWMAEAMSLAEKGRGFTSPNPLVGAVIVHNGRLLGEGYHTRYGALHAEREALKSCSESPRGATMVVTLEPCCHHGKQPPCTEAIIEAGIARVVVGLVDPNPLMSGKGIAALRAAGVEVEILDDPIVEQLARQNRIFLHYITNRRPYVTMKIAQTLDGKIATVSGDSRWVSGEESRVEVHRLRAMRSAVVVGIGTVLADNPMLNCRMEGDAVHQPIRVVVDSNARLPLTSQIVESASSLPTIVAHTEKADADKLSLLHKAGIETLLCKSCDEGVDIADLMRLLTDRKIDSLLVEGGSALNFSFLKSGFVDELYTYIAPKIVGGETAKSAVGGRGIGAMADALAFKIQEYYRCGSDLVVISRKDEYVYRNS